MTDTLKYGLQTAEVEALLARARELTGNEVRALDEVRGEVWGVTWNAPGYEARGAVRDVAQSVVWVEVLDMVMRDVVRDAVLALIARDLIAPEGFTQADYDLLTGPWRRVIGKVHPDDEEMK